jgi:hypothetical protein
MTMLDDAAKQDEAAGIEVRDVAEVMWEAIRGPAADTS